MRPRKLSALALVVCGLGLRQQTFAESKEVATPDLAGRWTLDREQSDDLRAKWREGREGAPEGERGERRRGSGGGGGGGPRGGGGYGGGGGGRGERPRGGGPGEGRESLREQLEPAPELLITPTTNEIVILEKDGRLRTLHPDGKAYKAEAGSAEVKTRWEGGGLVVETRMGAGPRLVETFALVAAPPPAEGSAKETATAESTKETPAAGAEAAPPLVLRITLRIDGTSRAPLEIKRVYQRTTS